ncbi:hypothetical protein M153_10129000148 [Pseudoloma neurophilia]|uniref:Uncharacterized protein n=1 Tax=Pseudoloma neurophilia TaxID=146866 RepID=A0A0R0LRQ5_9MICR|nr:hypothetical protein M153_10129000148 [Pseudoloma neurophilia]
MTSREITDQKYPEIMKKTRDLQSIDPRTFLNEKKIKHEKDLKKIKENQEILEKEPVSEEEKQEIINNDYNSMEKYINDKLQAGKWPSINSKNVFEKFHDYLLKNLPNFILDAKLGITVEIRYFLCTFIIIHIPSQYGFFFPKFLLNFIKIKKIKNKPIRDFLISVKRFFKFVEEGDPEYLTISTTIFREFRIGIDEDSLKWIREIPEHATKNPGKFILEFLFDWKLKADGYDKWKEENSDFQLLE